MTARRLKLLLVTDEMEVGGTQRQIVTIARGLNRQRFDVAVVFFRERSFLVDELEADGVRVVHIPNRGGVDIRFVFALRRFFASELFDVMHCFSYSGEVWATVARLLLPAVRRPALVTSIRGKYEWYSRFNWLMKRFATAQSDAVVANSRAGAEYAAQRMDWPTDRITVIYNGVPLSGPMGAARSVQRKGLGLAPERFALLFVGRLVDHKDLPTLLHAVRRLADGGTDLQLLIVGDGPLRGAVIRQIATLDIGQRVALLGERKDVSVLMGSSDALVLPSVREGLSNVILEAMTAGLPVVASRAGGNVELIEDGVDGLLFDVGAAEQLARSIERLATDAALRVRLAQAARLKAAAKFSEAAMIERMSALYQQVAKVKPEPVATEAPA